MTSTKKRIAIIFIVAVYAFSLISGIAYYLTNDVLAAFAETEDTTYAYYYDNLTLDGTDGKKYEYTLAKKFYNVLEEINKSGDFKKGQISYDLTSMLTSDQIKAWVEDGNLEIPKAFGAARDSFLMDHPELFYIDVYKIMISAGRTGGNYVAYIDSGKEANVYRDNSLTETAVNAAIIEYNNAVKNIADEATAKTADYTAKKDFALAIAVNEILAKTASYDFGTYNDGVNGNGSTASMAFTSYGALVYKKAVCSGYAMAYKAVMDYLEIPCIVVSGYSVGKDKHGNDLQNTVGHSWNYVQLETAKKVVETENQPAAQADEKNYEWFAFDTTWNSVNRERNKYSCMESFTASKEHSPYEVISSSNYSLSYPALSTLSYDKACDPSEMNTDVTEGLLNYKSVYTGAETTYTLNETVSYNGKNAIELLASEGLRLINRVYYRKNGEKQWGQWQDVSNLQEKGDAKHPETGIRTEDGETKVYVTLNVQYTQYAVVKDVEPDAAYTDLVSSAWGKVLYSEDAIKEENIVFMSQWFENATYGTYTAAPYVITEQSHPYMGGVVYFNDSMCEGKDSNMMADKYATTITLKYDEPLHVLDKTKPINVTVTPEKENAMQYCDFVKYADGSYVQLLEDENGVKNILQFKFKPSMMFEHNRIGYGFTFDNVGSAKMVEKKVNNELVWTTSDKTPNYCYYVFSRTYMACPKVFGDGRLWIDCCAQPVLADNSDLAAMDFKDEDGNSTFSEAERSQMMLVVNNVAPETKNTMLDEITDNSDINVNKNDIIESQTYDIKLQICGKHPTIPEGSYVKISLGFPEGYGPDDEGVTFKLFHRKHTGGDNYVIEEVPCVVTKFGIVATVTSFSPYMVAVVPKDKATDKTVYASIDGKGGKLSNEDGKIKTVEEGGICTYTFAPDEGYQLYKVTLNGIDVTSRVQSNQLQLTYDELSANNEIDVQYISNEATLRYAEMNVEIVDPVKVIVSVADQANMYTIYKEPAKDKNPVSGDSNKPNNVGLIVGIVIGVVVVLAAGVTAGILIAKKRKSNEE